MWVLKFLIKKSVHTVETNISDEAEDMLRFVHGLLHNVKDSMVCSIEATKNHFVAQKFDLLPLHLRT